MNNTHTHHTLSRLYAICCFEFQLDLLWSKLRPIHPMQYVVYLFLNWQKTEIKMRTSQLINIQRTLLRVRPLRINNFIILLFACVCVCVRWRQLFLNWWILRNETHRRTVEHKFIEIDKNYTDETENPWRETSSFKCQIHSCFLPLQIQ